MKYTSNYMLFYYVSVGALFLCTTKLHSVPDSESKYGKRTSLVVQSTLTFTSLRYICLRSVISQCDRIRLLPVQLFRFASSGFLPP